MINTEEQLIEMAKNFQTDYDRVTFVMNFFLQTVKYNYAYLVASGYMQGTISGLYGLKIKPNPFKIEGGIKQFIDGVYKVFDNSYVFGRDIGRGESKLFNDICSLKESCKGNYEKFIEELTKILIKKLGEHLDNSNLVVEEIFPLVEKIKNDMGNGEYISCKGKDFFVNNDISFVLLNYIANGRKIFLCETENDLLKKGVCEDYSNYLVSFFSKIGIEARRIDGTSNLKHSWIAIKIDGEYKFSDLTRAIYIRDGFKGIPKEQTCNDWLLAEPKKFFEMQPTRTITGIDLDENGKPIPTPHIINKDNFNMEEFALLLDGAPQRKHIR